MKKFLLPAFFILFALQSFSQLLSWNPEFTRESSSPMVINVDASKGNQDLFFYTPVTDVYVHIGVITNMSSSQSDWRYSKFTWATTPDAARAVSLGNSKWSYTITGGLRAYFGITNPGEKIEKVAILFRNGTGAKVQRNADGSDMFIPVSSGELAVRITTPFFQPTYNPIPETIVKNIGDNVPIVAKASEASTLKIYFNGNVITTQNNATEISATPSIVIGGNQQFIAEAFNGTVTKSDTLNIYVTNPITIAPLPAGVQNGINYTGNSSATLVLYAPGKTRVSVIGDFQGSNWNEQAQYQMNKTPDGNYWWLVINGLTPGTEYSYQYIVNGTLKIADPYAEKILDPWNDPYISSTTYPGLKAYPTGNTSGVVSILQTAKPSYNWDITNFQKPDKRNLIIYELLVRDFVAKHDWNTLRDTLNYLKKLGINAIEIMPFNEFEGNESWGYNPDYYFAPDKYYGPANTLKEFIDSCHKNGIAVLMDIALNHSFGLSPMVQLYWDAANNRPATNNPWFNPVAKHAFNVGYDMNHEKAGTKYYVSRIIDHWLNNYKIDGFRWDLSKGFTQNQTCDNSGGNCDVNGWGVYDASRVAIWKSYYDTMQLKSAGSYCILEHFAANNEEQELSNYGMMLWGNANYSYNQASMGYNSGSDFSAGFANVRNWTNPYLVTYMESHDEERLMYKNIQYGNASGSYNIKDLNTALKRQELVTAFFLTVPGPKMIWQFGELGYDYSINYCPDGSINDNCRVDNKPIRWDYLQQAGRKQLYEVYSKLIKLRTTALFKDAFVTNITEQSLSGNFKWIKLSATPSKLVVIGNFDVVPQTGSVTFPVAGTWYDYLNGNTIVATGSAQSFTLPPGAYHVFTNVNAALPVSLIKFDGIKKEQKNLLIWEVALEINLDFYEIEKSVDGQKFSPVGKIGATGKSSYQFEDNDINASAGIAYYRLKMVDKDSQVNYSAIIKIKRDATKWTVLLKPNPFVNSLKLSIESPFENKANILIIDLSGRRLLRKNISISSGINSFEINETARFAKGTYLLTIVSAGQKQTIKIIKNN